MGTSASRTRTAQHPFTHGGETAGPAGPQTTRVSQARQPCDLVTVPARQGLEAVDILRLRTSVGPVFHDHSGATLGFVVPYGTANAWDLPGSACITADGELGSFGVPPAADTGWLLPPHRGAPFTDPILLRAALGEAAVTLAAAERL